MPRACRLEYSRRLAERNITMPLGIAVWPLKRLFVLLAPVVIVLVLAWIAWKTFFLLDWKHLPAQPVEWPNYIAVTSAQVIEHDLQPRLPEVVATATSLVYGWCNGVAHFVAKVSVNFVSYLLDEWTAQHGAPALPGSGTP
jgi:hypothetical protein